MLKGGVSRSLISTAAALTSLLPATLRRLDVYAAQPGLNSAMERGRRPARPPWGGAPGEAWRRVGRSAGGSSRRRTILRANKKTVIYFRDELPPCQRPLEAVKCPFESG